MKQPTKGEQIVFADIVPLDDEALHDVRTQRYWRARRNRAADIDAAIAEAVKEWKQDAEKYRRVIASRVERELSKDEMIAQMLASGKAMNCTPAVSARCNAANAELDAAYIMLADDAKAALAAAIRARGNT